MNDIFRDFARDLFGGLAPEVPETIPLRILGLTRHVPTREVITSAFRRRVLEVHPDLRLAYDHPEIQQAAEDALGDKPEIRELVWARNVLIEKAPEPVTVTDKNGASVSGFYPSRPPLLRERICKQCRRVLEKRELVIGHGRRRAWCYRCVREDDRIQAAARRRQRRANRPCAAPGCVAVFTASRADGRYCSPRCRQVAYRGRVTANRGSAVEPRLSVTAQERVG